MRPVPVPGERSWNRDRGGRVLHEKNGPPGPLTGLRVADFSRVLAGPYATMMLADFGADVIKIESPQGDDTRSWLPPVDAQGESTYFGAVNRNKRAVVCDLATPAGLEVARRLAETADVVVENFRPGVLDRFGLGFDTVAAANPGVVYCSITGFGRGAGARLPGYDLLVQAVGGLMSVTGAPDGEPSKVGVALVDVLAGLNALSGILLALRARDAARAATDADSLLDVDSGSVRVEVDLMGSLLSALTNQAAGTLATGLPPTRLGNAHPSIAPYELFAGQDRAIVIAVGTDRQFRTLVRLLGAPELADDARFADNPARVRHRAVLKALLEVRLGAQPAAAWVATLTDAGVPAGLVNTIDEAFTFAADLGLAPVVELSGSRQVANPIHLAGRPPDHRLPPPRLGEHNGADWLRPQPAPPTS
jgi:crotonobetainyl-CoA:carnitine CoA-transferase CaiB-like acyl-CoA transferase